MLQFEFQIRSWITLFFTLQHHRKGYANRNITPYMHAAGYHIQDVLNKFKNLKQFSGQGMNIYVGIIPMRFANYFFFPFFTGVGKNNDVARSIVLCKSNNFNSPAEVIQAEHRINMLCKREGRKEKTVHQGCN